MKKFKQTMKQNLLKVLALSLVFSTAVACSNADNPKRNGKTFILVHGAWQASFVWDNVKEQLEKQGHRVIAVELPAHGKDISPIAEATLDNYVAKVKSAMNQQEGKIILVGHSLGGAVITQAAAELPDKTEKVVYIAGFVPLSGESVNSLSALDKQSEISLDILIASQDFSTVTFANPEINIPKIFCHDATLQQKTLLIQNLKAEPTAPMGTPLQYNTEVFEKTDKYYIYTKQDRAISYGFQQKMAQKAGINKTFIIDASHSPFVSKPKEVAAILQSLTK
jgi:pimeloyl-ACP methyl ester carboxylesterase